MISESKYLQVNEAAVSVGGTQLGDRIFLSFGFIPTCGLADQVVVLVLFFVCLFV